MSRQLPSVQHWVVCQDVVEEPPVYQLVDVCYLYAFGSPSGFPRLDDPDALPPAAPQIAVFCRFFGGEGVADLEVRLGWLDAPEPHRPFQVDVRPYRVEF